MARVPEKWKSLAARRCRECLGTPFSASIVIAVALLYHELDLAFRELAEEDSP